MDKEIEFVYPIRFYKEINSESSLKDKKEAIKRAEGKLVLLVDSHCGHNTYVPARVCEDQEGNDKYSIHKPMPQGETCTKISLRYDELIDLLVGGETISHTRRLKIT